MSVTKLPSVTRVFLSGGFHMYRALVMSLLNVNALKWRINGIGMLQAYVYECDYEEVRIHVYHNDLKLPNIHELGGIHDHRFFLDSDILSGGLKHTEYDVTNDPNGTWQICEAVHARAQQEGERSEYPTGTRVKFTPSYTHNLTATQQYMFPAQCFHETEAEDYTVTLIRKLRQQDIRARFLAPIEIKLPETIMMLNPYQVNEVAGDILNTARQKIEALWLDYTTPYNAREKLAR